jgi:RNA recognition motif-containing protein
MPETEAILFVGNLCSDANENYLARLFKSYGDVTAVALESDNTHHFALITYSNPDDADSAIAALHARYCMTPEQPIIVLYSSKSPAVTQYGRKVGALYKECVQAQKPPTPVALEAFDAEFARGVPAAPPVDLPAVPPTNAPGSS